MQYFYKVKSASTIVHLCSNQLLPFLVGAVLSPGSVSKLS